MILHITQSYQEDEGEYSVEAKNTFGTVRTTAELLLSGECYILTLAVMSIVFVFKGDCCAILQKCFMFCGGKNNFLI